jgi:hypothetical protein
MVNNKLEGIWKAVTVIQSRHYTGGTEENHKIPESE